MVPPSWRHPAVPPRTVGRPLPTGQCRTSPADGATGRPRVSRGCPRDVLPCARRGLAPTPLSLMSTLTTEQLATGRGTAAEVIAGLANDGSALTVARAAVEEAMSRHCGVRFVQVVSPGLDAEARAEVDAATFQAALNALRGQPAAALHLRGGQWQPRAHPGGPQPARDRPRGRGRRPGHRRLRGVVLPGARRLRGAGRAHGRMSTASADPPRRAARPAGAHARPGDGRGSRSTSGPGPCSAPLRRGSRTCSPCRARSRPCSSPYRSSWGPSAGSRWVR